MPWQLRARQKIIHQSFAWRGSRFNPLDDTFISTGRAQRVANNPRPTVHLIKPRNSSHDHAGRALESKNLLFELKGSPGTPWESGLARGEKTPRRNRAFTDLEEHREKKISRAAKKIDESREFAREIQGIAGQGGGGRIQTLSTKR